LEDPRQERGVTYKIETMVWLGLLFFILKIGARRQINFVATKNFYLLMQTAHIINQLIEKSSLLTTNDWKYLGSIKNLTRRLFEDLRYNLFDSKEIETASTKRFQIRFDTS